MAGAGFGKSLDIPLADADGDTLAERGVASTRDDGDDAVDGVRAPEWAAGAANDFDTFDLVDGEIQRLPADAAEQRGVRRAAIDQQKHRAGEAAHRVPAGDGPFVGVPLAHVQPGHQAQGVGKSLHAGASQGGLIDDEDGRGRIGAALLAPAGHGHGQVEQLLEFEIEQVIGQGLRARVRGDERDADGNHDSSDHSAKPSPCVASHSPSDSTASGGENR